MCKAYQNRVVVKMQASLLLNVSSIYVQAISDSPTFCLTKNLNENVYVHFPGYNWALIMLTMIGKFAITSAFGIIYVFSAELFPTVIRNTGLGAASFWARIGGIVAPQIALLVSTAVCKE